MQILHKSHKFFIKTFSTSPIITNNNKWRNQVNQTQLITQVSNIILQRHTNNWQQLFKTLNLSTSKSSKSILTPHFYYQIFNKIQQNPKISLIFFNFAIKNLDFIPDLRTQCKLIYILFRSGLLNEGKLILYSLIEAYQPDKIVSSIIEKCDKSSDFDGFSCILSCVIECYCSKNMFLEGLEVYVNARNFGVLVSVYSCNVLLNLLNDKNEVGLAWCLYGSMKRNGVVENQLTWSTIGEILSKCGKGERVERILDLGICSDVLYNVVIGFCSRRGNFEGAFCYLDEMYCKKLDPSIGTYSSILDGACKYRDEGVIRRVISVMVEKRFFPKDFMLDMECNLLIQKLSDMGNSYAAEFVFRKAGDEKVKIRGTSYGCMLQAFSKEGRVKEAIDIHQIVSRKNILVDEGCYRAFLECLCMGSPSEEVSESLKEVIGRRFRPSGTLLSKYISSLCSGKKWKQAEELLDIVLDKGFLLDSCCCSLLVDRYCSIRRIDLALELHHKLIKLESTFDVKAYNFLLKGLFREKRVEEAERIFEFMRRYSTLSCECFTMMIHGLCQEKKFREAMKLHDEMLKLGLKPHEKTYKRLISGFQ
ncbi:hypothetical protein Leryth_024210 [Lithospermum erythrorhizon]|nr:hypothetical protein Leryth_024210 [Lithospermum erythrorhizon]